jgi:hypothetical protein
MKISSIKEVTAQAVIDAASNCKTTESLVEKHKVISWVSDFSQDFVYTCTLADCDPVNVKIKIEPIPKALLKKQIKPLYILNESCSHMSISNSVVEIKY